MGVGYLGKFHAQKYKEIKDIDLVGVSDTNEEVGHNRAKEFGCGYYPDYNDLVGKCDMVSVVVPSYAHYKVGKTFLENGVHCLIEKPFATTLSEAIEMKEIAKKNSLMLSVGHLERFNPVFRKIQELCSSPQYIITERLAVRNNRSLDINVVLDLMIHDLDLVLQLMDSHIKAIHCLGIKVVSEYTDSANAYIIFENGAAANMSVSRISMNKSRKIRIFQPELYISADLDLKTCKVARQSLSGEVEQAAHDMSNGNKDTLLLEIENCIEAVRSGKPALVTPDSATETLEAALEISRQLKDSFGEQETLQIIPKSKGQY